MYQIKQDKFEGPVDVLLELIEGQKLSINEISLGKVTDEFIAYFKKLEEHETADQEVLAEFLVIAAQLLLIKSRSLLPQFQVSPEEEGSVAELVDRLRQYQRLKELAQELGPCPQRWLKLCLVPRTHSLVESLNTLLINTCLVFR